MRGLGELEVPSVESVAAAAPSSILVELTRSVTVLIFLDVRVKPQRQAGLLE